MLGNCTARRFASCMCPHIFSMIEQNIVLFLPVQDTRASKSHFVPCESNRNFVDIFSCVHCHGGNNMKQATTRAESHRTDPSNLVSQSDAKNHSQFLIMGRHDVTREVRQLTWVK